MDLQGSVVFYKIIIKPIKHSVDDETENEWSKVIKKLLQFIVRVDIDLCGIIMFNMGT